MSDWVTILAILGGWFILSMLLMALLYAYGRDAERSEAYPEPEYVGTYKIECLRCQHRQSAAHSYCGFCGLEFNRPEINGGGQ